MVDEARRITLLKAVGACLIAAALLRLLGWRGLQFLITLAVDSTARSKFGRPADVAYILVLGFFLYIAIPGSQLVSGYGLLRSRGWGRWLASRLLLLDCIVSCFSIVNLWVAWFMMRDVVEPLLRNPPGGTVVQEVSMLPTYFRAFLDLIGIFILTRPSVVSAWDRHSGSLTGAWSRPA